VSLFSIIASIRALTIISMLLLQVMPLATPRLKPKHHLTSGQPDEARDE
jgi:hypothetical protein